MKLLQFIHGHGRTLFRATGRRFYATRTQDYLRRNYADNVSEYNTVLGSVTAQRRHYLLRDVYEDMMLDGVQPTRDTFHALIAGTMKGARLQDAFYFRDEMKAMGLVPDVALYNLLISTCGKCRNSELAIQIFEEMKRSEVKPTGQTYICLLNACALTGRIDRVQAIVRDMIASGLGLNKFCYAGLIVAQKNKTPLTDDTATKILELVEQSKGWSGAEPTGATAENFMMGVSLDELYNLPSGEYIHRRGFLDKRLTIYHVAFNALADLCSVEAMETLKKMLENDNRSPDGFITMQIMRCYLNSRNLDLGYKVFEDYMNSGKASGAELYLTLIEGAMLDYTPKGMELAHNTLVNMTARNFLFGPKVGSDLLLIAAGEKAGGYTTANYLWDLMESRNIIPSPPAVEAYYEGLKGREIPGDDPRMLKVTTMVGKLRPRFSGRP